MPSQLIDWFVAPTGRGWRTATSRLSVSFTVFRPALATGQLQPTWQNALRAAGLAVSIRRYPAIRGHSFWTSPSFQEWSCQEAALILLDEQGPAGETLCDFAAIPTSLIQRSVPLEGDYEVVAPGGKGGVAAEDYAGLDVKRHSGAHRRGTGQGAEQAVRQRGAAGILFRWHSRRRTYRVGPPGCPPVHVVLVGIRSRSRWRGLRAQPTPGPASAVNAG